MILVNLCFFQSFAVDSPAQYSCVILFLVSLLHELAHALTNVFNTVAGTGLKTTPDKIGSIIYEEGTAARPDCVFEFEELLMGGTLMPEIDNQLVFTQIIDKTKAFNAPGNLVKRVVRPDVINHLYDALEQFMKSKKAATTSFPIQSLRNLGKELSWEPLASVSDVTTNQPVDSLDTPHFKYAVVPRSAIRPLAARAVYGKSAESYFVPPPPGYRR